MDTLLFSGGGGPLPHRPNPLPNLMTWKPTFSKHESLTEFPTALGRRRRWLYTCTDPGSCHGTAGNNQVTFPGVKPESGSGEVQRGISCLGFMKKDAGMSPRGLLMVTEALVFSSSPRTTRHCSSAIGRNSQSIPVPSQLLPVLLYIYKSILLLR